MKGNRLTKSKKNQFKWKQKNSKADFLKFFFSNQKKEAAAQRRNWKRVKNIVETEKNANFMTENTLVAFDYDLITIRHKHKKEIEQNPIHPKSTSFSSSISLSPSRSSLLHQIVTRWRILCWPLILCDRKVFEFHLYNALFSLYQMKIKQ